jgi:malic enzyme
MIILLSLEALGVFVSIPTFKRAALDCHAFPQSGKIVISLTKPVAPTTHLAHSIGVVELVREIAGELEALYRYTGKGNLIAVISDGSAILIEQCDIRGMARIRI